MVRARGQAVDLDPTWGKYAALQVAVVGYTHINALEWCVCGRAHTRVLRGQNKGSHTRFTKHQDMNFTLCFKRGQGKGSHTKGSGRGSHTGVHERFWQVSPRGSYEVSTGIENRGVLRWLRQELVNQDSLIVVRPRILTLVFRRGRAGVQRRVRQTKGSYTRVQPGLVQEFPNSTICRRPEGTS